ncbi:hypothetical protein JRQ81_008943 [Phrynocephalus forsythii]|uniref:Amyloid beta precursor protein binding family A member 3 n=1 Tax=Phrynocephalus forsythii TaxID=171643 RepID=A0A9Q0XD05_9SAUR|nr:hypothetical protein JRQ81_008943 [Phrynocephalus forsythii]
MTDTAFPAEGILGGGAPTDLPEPTPVSLEEIPGTPREAPAGLGDETNPRVQEDLGPAVLPPLDVREPDLCLPGTDEIRTDPDGPGPVLDPPQTDTQRCPELNPKTCSGDAAEEGAPEPKSRPQRGFSTATDPGEAAFGGEENNEEVAEECPEAGRAPLRSLLEQLQRLDPSSQANSDGEEDSERRLLLDPSEGPESRAAATPCLLHVATGHGLASASRQLFRPAHSRKDPEDRGLFSAETVREDLLSLLHYEGGVPEETGGQTPLACSEAVSEAGARERRVPAGNPEPPPDTSPRGGRDSEGLCPWIKREDVHPEGRAPPGPAGEGSSEGGDAATASASGRKEAPAKDPATKADLPSFPDFKEVPGPCDAEDLMEGVIFGAKYLGSTQLVSERNPPASIRMAQAQEAMDRIKAPEGESQPMTDVDLFVSTQRIKVLTADSQETMMDHPLQSISYIADIGTVVVLMARRRLPRRADTPAEKQLYKMICHVFRSDDVRPASRVVRGPVPRVSLRPWGDDPLHRTPKEKQKSIQNAQLIAQAIGQAFSVAYQHFLQASGIDPSQLAARDRGAEGDDDDDALAKAEDLYNGDLAHFSKQENCKEVVIPKQRGEILGLVIVESGWGSILPTVVIANLMHRGAAERSGKLSIGDRIMSVNGTSLVGLPLATCQSIIRDVKNQTEVTLRVVHCPPVTTAIVRRPDAKYPLGFCVENGIICSLMRGGIAERGGIRVGHRIIEINGQSVVAMPHEKIIQILTQAVSEVRIKTMPASTYRLLTGQEQPVFL